MNERITFEREINELESVLGEVTRPIPEQAGPRPCKGKSPKPVPDSPSTDLTGRYYTRNPSQAVVINQAGVHFEAVISRVSRLAASRNRGYNARPADKESHRQIKVIQGDQVKPGEFRWFNRDKSSDSGFLRMVGGKVILTSSTDNSEVELVPMERRPTLMGTVPILRTHGWDMNRLERYELQPLVPWQKQQIENILDPQALNKIFHGFFVAQIRNPDPLGVLLNRISEFRAKGVPGYSPETKFDQFPLADLELVREYARRVLTLQQWTSHRNVTRSHLDWIQIMIDQSTGTQTNPYDNEFARQFGLVQSPRDRRGQHTYLFTISIAGLSLGLGGFSGSVTITKTNDRKWGPKVFDIDLWGLNAVTGFVDVKLGETWKGTAESYLEWTENDINGPVRFFGAKASAGMDLAKARTGFMHVLGDERMPPLEVFFGDAKLGVPNPDKITEKTLKNKIKGEDLISNPKDLLKPSAGAAVLFGDISSSGSILERLGLIRKPYDPIDLSRKLPPPEQLGAEAQSEAHFCLDDDQLTPAGVQALRGLCARQLALFTSEGAYLMVVGHADTLGHKIPGHNQKLSERRAANVAAAMKGILGSRFKVKNITTTGFGDKFAALASQGKIAAAPEHRRVDVYLNGSLELSMFG